MSREANGEAPAKRRSRDRIPFLEAAPLESVPGREGVEARIIDAARRLLIQYSSARLSMNDVAELAGVSRGTVYNRFPDRGALLQAVEDAAAVALGEAMDRAMTECSRLDEQVVAAALCVVKWDEAISATGMLTSADRLKLIAQPHFVMNVLLNVFRKYIEDAHARGEVRQDLNIDQAAEWVTRTVASLVVFPGQTFRLDRPSEVSEFFAAHVVRGLI